MECVTRFSTSSFFHDSKPSGPLINRLKYFRIRFRFRRDIRIFKKLCGVHPTAESDSAVCITPRSQTRGVHHTTESSDEEFSKSSGVCITPRSQTPRWAVYCGVKLRGVHHTTESINYQVSILIRSFTNAISL